MTELEKKLIAALRPFADMADVIDDAGDLVDDEDEREDVKIIFGGMFMGYMKRDDFQAAWSAVYDD